MVDYTRYSMQVALQAFSQRSVGGHCVPRHHARMRVSCSDFRHVDFRWNRKNGVRTRHVSVPCATHVT